MKGPGTARAWSYHRLHRLRQLHQLHRLHPKWFLPAFWRWCDGRTTTATTGRKTTPAFLRGRRLLLPALALATLALAAAAYFDVHARTEHIRDRLSPALTQLASTRESLVSAQREAVRRFGKAAGNTPVASGDKFQGRIGDAKRGLERTAQSGALDAGERQELQVVSGLLRSYEEKIGLAERHSASRPLRLARLDYAARILCSGVDEGSLRCRGRAAKDVPVTLLERVEKLESDLRARTHEQAQGSTPAALGGAAYALAVLLAAVLLGTHFFLRGQLRLRSLPLLLLAPALVLTLAVLTARAVTEHTAQRAVDRAVAERRDDPGHALDSLADAWTQVARVTVGLGAAAAVGCGLALHGYVRDYPSRSPRRRTAP
ncbi:hypothetical protein ACFQVC_19065 [Streptomyces monticola]|uniref:Integral membrane protein n=1 Tax=Streptomyces monticola TaxID=2666263 RepID=A0ABW2JJL1_9ACTN